MEHLCKAATDIAAIIQHIDQFATWWQEQDTMLKSLSDGIHQLRPTHNNRIRLAGVKANWGRIERTYLAYVTKVRKPVSRSRLGTLTLFKDWPTPGSLPFV